MTTSVDHDLIKNLVDRIARLEANQATATRTVTATVVSVDDATGACVVTVDGIQATVFLPKGYRPSPGDVIQIQWTDGDLIVPPLTAGSVSGDALPDGAITGPKIDPSVPMVPDTGQPPATPTGVTVTDGIGSVFVKWDPATEPDMTLGFGVHQVAWATNAQFTGAQIVETGSNMVAITGLPTGVTVYVQVRAVSAPGRESGWSATVSGAPITIQNVDIAPNAVQAPQIAPLSVTGPAIASSSVTADKLAANSVTAGKIDANAVTAGNIAANAVQANNIAAYAVQATNLAAGSVTANALAANSITSDKLVANAVTADKLDANAINGKTITGVTITGSTLQSATSGGRVVISNAQANQVQLFPSNPAYPNPATVSATYDSLAISAPTGSGGQPSVLTLDGTGGTYPARIAGITADQFLVSGFTALGSGAPVVQLARFNGYLDGSGNGGFTHGLGSVQFYLCSVWIWNSAKAAWSDGVAMSTGISVSGSGATLTGNSLVANQPFRVALIYGAPGGAF